MAEGRGQKAEMEKLNGARVAARNYRDLIVWQKSMDLVEIVYQLTKGFPREETYGLKSQLQRAVASVPSNIAEGQARGSQKIEFQRFLYLALGSLAEVDTQLELAIRLKYLKSEDREAVNSLMDEIRKMLFGLIRTLKNRSL